MIADTAQLAVELKLGTIGSFRAATSELAGVEAAAGRASLGFGRVSGAAGKFGGALGHAKSQLGGLLTGPLGILGLSAGLFTFAGAIEQGIGKAQELGQTVIRLSAITGLDTQTTSALSVAMEHFNVTADSQIRLVGFLEKNVGLLAARKDGLAGFQKTFGLALTDSNGHVKDANQLILTLADYWNNKGIPATEKAAAMSKLLGRSWQELIPFLTAGRQGIAAAEAEAAKFGLTLSRDDVAALKEAKAASRDWNTALAGLETRIGLALLPELTNLAKTTTKFVAENRDKIVGFFRDAAKFGRDFGGVIEHQVIPVFKGIAGAWEAVPKPLRDLLVGGFVANKALKWTFGIDVAGGLAGQFFARGAPGNPMWVAVEGGLSGAGGGGGLLSAFLAGSALPVILTAGTIAALSIAFVSAMGMAPDVVPPSQGGTPGQVFSRGHGFGPRSGHGQSYGGLPLGSLSPTAAIMSAFGTATGAGLAAALKFVEDGLGKLGRVLQVITPAERIRQHIHHISMFTDPELHAFRTGGVTRNTLPEIAKLVQLYQTSLAPSAASMTRDLGVLRKDLASFVAHGDTKSAEKVRAAIKAVEKVQKDAADKTAAKIVAAQKAAAFQTEQAIHNQQLNAYVSVTTNVTASGVTKAITSYVKAGNKYVVQNPI